MVQVEQDVDCYHSLDIVTIHAGVVESRTRCIHGRFVILISMIDHGVHLKALHKRLELVRYPDEELHRLTSLHHL